MSSSIQSSPDTSNKNKNKKQKSFVHFATGMLAFVSFFFNVHIAYLRWTVVSLDFSTFSSLCVDDDDDDDDDDLLNSRPVFSPSLVFVRRFCVLQYK